MSEPTRTGTATSGPGRLHNTGDNADYAKLRCNMAQTCTSPITHIGEKGWVYCSNCAADRQYWERCRRLRQWEIRRLERGECISYKSVSRMALAAILARQEQPA